MFDLKHRVKLSSTSATDACRMRGSVKSKKGAGRGSSMPSSASAPLLPPSAARCSSPPAAAPAPPRGGDDTRASLVVRARYAVCAFSRCPRSSSRKRRNKPLSASSRSAARSAREALCDRPFGGASEGAGTGGAGGGAPPSPVALLAGEEELSGDNVSIDVTQPLSASSLAPALRRMIWGKSVHARFKVPT